MFLGEYKHTIDVKGRLTVPAKFRGQLAAGLVVTRGFERNLMLYPLTEWQHLYGKIMASPISDPISRVFRRRIMSGAADIKPDKQGRMVVPPYLREFAGIIGEVVIIGMGSHLEIWNAEMWKIELADIESNDDGERWSELGI